MPKKGQDLIKEVYINNHAKDITMISYNDLIKNDFNTNIHFLVCLNSPIIYISKEFLELKKWINSHFSKKVYIACQTKLHGHTGRKDYLYDF